MMTNNAELVDPEFIDSNSMPAHCLLSSSSVNGNFLNENGKRVQARHSKLAKKRKVLSLSLANSKFNQFYYYHWLYFYLEIQLNISSF
jgi:hypothetical protein